MEKSAGAVIFRKEGKKTFFLLLKYGGGHWDFVKGHVEPGEDDVQTLKREAAEETGLSDLKIVPNFNEKISYYFKKDGAAIYKEVVFFLAETKTKKITLSFEHVDFAWLEYSDSLQRATYDNAKEILKKAGKKLGV